MPSFEKNFSLITGGSGFIGTYLARALTAQGHRVRVLDLVDPKTAVPGVEYVRGDIRDREKLGMALRDVDSVYHFAAIVSVPVCQNDVVESTSINELGTAMVAEAAVAEASRRGKPGSVRMIFASSAAVYGHRGRAGVGLDESEVSDRPLSFYGAQKLGSEKILKLFYEHKGLPSVVFRFFNVFGLGQDPKSPYSGVITVFSRLLSEGKPLVLNDAGEPTRDFISVVDIARANTLALKLPVGACDAEPINLGTGQSVSIAELGRLMVGLWPKGGQCVSGPPREGDVKYSQASIKRARQVLGFEPSIAVRDGMGEFLRDVQKTLA